MNSDSKLIFPQENHHQNEEVEDKMQDAESNTNQKNIDTNYSELQTTTITDSHQTGCQFNNPSEGNIDGLSNYNDQDWNYN